MMRKVSVFFFWSVVLLMTLRVYGYRPRTLDLLADTSVDAALVPLYDTKGDDQSVKEPQGQEEEFREENPEITSQDEETLIEDE